REQGPLDPRCSVPGGPQPGASRTRHTEPGLAAPRGSGFAQAGRRQGEHQEQATQGWLGPTVSGMSFARFSIAGKVGKDSGTPNAGKVITKSLQPVDADAPESV